MLNKLLARVAPHYCYGCTKIGTVLCLNCKYDITDEHFSACVVCERPSTSGICESCRTSYDKAWCAGSRSGVLKQLIDAYKFERVKSIGETLAGVMNDVLPVLPKGTVIVPVPTLSSHVRQRGYDHTLEIAKHLRSQRALKIDTGLKRVGKDMQRDSGKKKRFDQAKSAFDYSGKINPKAQYLLIDDVVTTNATMRYAAQALLDAGAKSVWVAVVAHQPLEK